MAQPSDLHVPAHPVRFVTAAALFDGHDAAINIMRRILQAQGAEVIHLGHDRSVREVVDAVLDEDAQAVAISSYQGGHVEYFEYLAESLDRVGAGHVTQDRQPFAADVDEARHVGGPQVRGHDRGKRVGAHDRSGDVHIADRELPLDVHTGPLPGPTGLLAGTALRGVTSDEDRKLLDGSGKVLGQRSRAALLEER